MKKGTMLLSLCVLFLSVLQAQILHYDGFESGEINPDIWNTKSATPRMAIINEIARAGKQGIKFYWNPSFFLGDNASKHSEIAGIYPTNSERESWYGWSIYFPSKDFGLQVNAIDSEPMIVSQWHLRGGGTHPPMAIRVVNGKWSFGYNWGKDHVDEKHENVNFGAVPLNKWVDLVVHVKWSTNTGTGNESFANDGIIEVWKDGESLLNKRNIPVGFGNSGGKGWPYFKIGIYHHTGKAIGSKAVCFDEVRHGYNSNYAEVAPANAIEK